MVAFDKAIRGGADMIELDVRLTKDGEVVVIHDSLLARTAHSAGRVEARTFEHLRSLDVGAWFDSKFRGERIPLLEEVLQLAAGHVGLNIEMKVRRTSPTAELLVQAVAALAAAWKDRLPLLVSSFHRPAIDKFRTLQPDVPAWYIYSHETSAPDPAHFKASCPFAIVESALAIPPLVEKVHKKQGRVLVWTVDDPARMRELLDMGVDGIVSNRPALLKSVRDEWVVSQVGAGGSRLFLT